MNKSTNFSGQPISNQLLMFLGKGQIKKISKVHEGKYIAPKKQEADILKCVVAQLALSKLNTEQVWKRAREKVLSNRGCKDASHIAPLWDKAISTMSQLMYCMKRYGNIEKW